MMKKDSILRGYVEYFEKSIEKDGDPHVLDSYHQDGIWYLYRSFEAFDDEMSSRERDYDPIPKNELIIEHWKKYPCIG